MMRLLESKDSVGRRVVYNPDNDRAVSIAPFGIALYSYVAEDGNATATHQGMVCDDEKAMEWLEGGSPPKTIIYDDGEKRRGLVG